MSTPTQYQRDPATGEFVECRWVCPACHTVNVGAICVNCPLADDADEAKEPTDLFVPDIGGSD